MMGYPEMPEWEQAQHRRVDALAESSPIPITGRMVEAATIVGVVALIAAVTAALVSYPLGTAVVGLVLAFLIAWLGIYAQMTDTTNTKEDQP